MYLPQWSQSLHIRSNVAQHFQYSRCFVKSYGWYQCSDYVYITMEHLSLGDLSKHMKAPMQEVHASQITSQVLEGLSFMHKNGFAHRDLKPNVSTPLLC